LRLREEVTIRAVQETLSHSSVFECMFASFQQALNAHSNLASEKHYLFAGRPTRVRVVGKRLAEYSFLPFSHLQMDYLHSDNFQLTIDLWDEAETGIPCPVGSQDVLITQRTITASPDSRFLIEQDLNSLVSFNRKSRHFVCSFASANKLVDRSKPLNRLLALWYKDRGIPIIHAGFVADSDRGVLIAGSGGAGKSTLAMICLHSGFYFLGDDQTGLEKTASGSFVGHSLYNSVRLNRDHLNNLFPQFRNVSHTDCFRDDKSAVFLSEVLPKQLRSVVPIRVLVLPRIVNAPDSRMYHATKAEALSVLASSSIVTMLGFDANDLDQIASFVERVPVYQIELGYRMEGIPHLIRQLISRGV